MRIYVGGLGSSVQEDDLKKTFSSPQLGTVESVEIIRSKGRSFGYLDFVPSSEKGLAKLFSAYNGCMWKGGKLKLEKAKEHYLQRLRREQEEEAELEIKLSSQNVDADESVHPLQKPKNDEAVEKMQLKIFFPKLRKIKAVPLKGTGKHKYSFQRVEVPRLSVHFCDCEEHSGPPESAKKNCTDDHEIDPCVVNEDELNMMKLILNKLLDEDNCSKAVANKAEFTEEINHDVTSTDNWQVDDDEEDQGSDEDNLVINMVGQTSKRTASLEDWGQKTIAANQYSLAREPLSFGRPIHDMHGSKKGKLLPDKKRKQSACENYSNDTVPSKRNTRKSGTQDSKDDPIAVNTQPTDTESGSIQLSCDVANSQKSAWRDLASEKGSTAFHLSDILTGTKPEVEAKPRSEGTKPEVEAKPRSDCLAAEVEKDGQDDQSSKDKELEKLSDFQSTKPSAFEDKSARGASWLQKSSWLQLVGDSNNSTFSLSNILPGVTFEKQDLQQFSESEFSNSRNGKQHSFGNKAQNSPTEDISKPQGRASEDIHTTTRNQNLGDLTMEQNHTALGAEQSNSVSKQQAEENDEASAPVHGSDLVPSNRAVGDIVISETCPFMKSAASMREWAKTKAALSGLHKKRGKGKEQVQD